MQFISQRRVIFDERLKADRDYWLQKLSGQLTRTSIPSDYEHNDIPIYAEQSLYFQVPEHTAKQIGILTKQSPLLIYTTLLTSLIICLHKYTGNNTIIVGSPGQIKSAQKLAEPNVVAIVSQIQPHVSFRRLLVQMREVLQEAYQHQQYPFDYLLRDLAVVAEEAAQPPSFQPSEKQQDKQHSSPIFDIMVALEDFHQSIAPDFKSDISLHFVAKNQQIYGTITFNANTFRHEMITRFSQHILTTLSEALEQPSTPITQLQLLPPYERNQQLNVWNATHESFPQHRSVHQLFEDQVAQTPDAPAVCFEAEQLTYSELNQRANALASWLQAHGVGPETLVGLYIERSSAMIVALLGILKAGGAYIPLDPTYTKERIAGVFADSGMAALVTQIEFMSSLPDHQLPVVCLPLESSTSAELSNPQLNIKSEQLAYVIYTSGSTGHPKGVAVEHRQLLNYCLSIQARLDFGAVASYATVSTLAADLGNTVIFPALCSGGCLHVISYERASDPVLFGEYVRTHPIDCLKIVPSHLAALLSGPQPASLLPRQRLILGGEPAPWSLIEQIRSLAPECVLINHYGPTETTVGVLTYQIPSGLPENDTVPVPLGRPLANTQIYLLDQHLHPVPIGIPGELYVGGANVARGYLGQADLTAERFVPNPFVDLRFTIYDLRLAASDKAVQNPKSKIQNGERLYRTGDLARYRPDGTIEFLGRTDHQIKLRGFRIELEEIEQALRQHPAVQQATVLLREDHPNQQRLVGYVVPQRRNAPLIDGRLRYVLPNNMAIVHLNKNETDYLYTEIFEKQAYLQHGITIGAGDCIVDVGANIGLFTLFAHYLCNDSISNLTIYALEPVPETFQALAINAELYNTGAKTINAGLSNQKITTKLTFFPKFSILSGRYTDVATEKQVVKSFMRNQHQAGVVGMDVLLQHSDELLEDRFTSTTVSVQLITLSDLMREHQIEQIDLLKINVEKSEIDVLSGIQAGDWAKIKQIVLEVDVGAQLEQILDLLKRQGYDIVVEQDALLRNTDLCYVYARHPRAIAQPASLQPQSLQQSLPVLDNPILTVDRLRSFLKERLPDYMLPTAIVLLDALPRTSNGKIDRRALPPPEQIQSPFASTYVEPRTSTEELLAGLWSHLLGREQVGTQDNFFELGGHSLLASRLIAHIRDVLQIEIPVREIFEHPTIAQLADWISRHYGTLPTIPPLEPAPRDIPLALAFGQQRLWFLNQLEPTSSFYSTHTAAYLRGPLNIPALKRTLNEVVRRHEVLRTTFQLVDDQLVQVIAPAHQAAIPVVDLSLHAAMERELIVQQLVDQEGRHPFDLAEGPLVRAKLLLLSSEEHILLLSVHHTVFDAWSRGIFLREAITLYEAFCAGNTTPLADLPIQYADFAYWQRQWLQGALLAEQLAYWKNQLQDVTVLELPTDRPRPATQTFRGDAELLTLTPVLTKALKALSYREGVTLFMTLLAAFQVVLYRYTSQVDICVSTGSSSRTLTKTESLIGFFVNTLVLRTNVSGNPSFRELLRRVREIALGAYAHQEVPFDLVVEAIQPERDPRFNPLFQVALVLQNVPTPSLKPAGLDLQFLRVSNNSAKLDLTLNLLEQANGLVGSLEYNSDLFNASTIVRMLQHFVHVLEQIVADPQQRLSSISLLSAAEHERFTAWNATVVQYSGSQLIHQRFEAQAARIPDHVAVVCGQQQLTYRELNRHANQLAHDLQQLGAGPEMLVGLFIERSLEAIIGLLAILKAGGAYVPLDPAYPLQRLAAIMADAGIRILLTRSNAELNILPDVEHIVSLDMQASINARPDYQNPTSAVMTDNLVYVIYTSGSTGTPKGVLVTHEGLCNLVESQIRDWHIHSGSRVLQFASLNFDASVAEIFTALLSGATLYLSSSDTPLLGMDLLHFLREHAITTVTLPPSALTTLVPTDVPALTTIVSAGEACTLALIQRWGTGRQFVNGYGPTEVTVGACWANCTPDLDYVPIGSPPPNIRLYVLDQARQLVPVGIPGELYVGGRGVSRGYLNRPDLTAERFGPDPFSGEIGARLYRTGDRVRYHEDGQLEFLGRIDQQIKLRGYRIEPGEIEHLLRLHPGVHDCLVTVQQDMYGHQRLVAYIIPQTEQQIDFQALHAFMVAQLPAYMVPSDFTTISAWPLTPNGKIDRRALPKPERLVVSPQTPYEAPRTSVEKLLASVWAEVLRLEQVSIHDNFFQLGGDSLLVMRVIARAKQLGLLLAPRQAFQYQTIAELATFCNETVSVQTNDNQIDMIPLLPIHLLCLSRADSNPHIFNMNSFWEVHYPLVPNLVKEATKSILIHHEALRMRFTHTTLSGWQGYISEISDVIPFSLVDLSNVPKYEQSAAIEEYATNFQSSLNITEGPVIRVVLFKLNYNQPDRLLFVIHHFACDGFSLEILLEDFQIAYSQLEKGDDVKFPPKTTSIKHYTSRLKEYAYSETLSRELDYWTSDIRMSATSLPVDYPQGVYLPVSKNAVVANLGKTDTKQLELLSRYQISMRDVLLAGLYETHMHWTNNPTFLIEYLHHGRNTPFDDVDLSRTISWLNTLTPIVINITPNSNPKTVLQSIKMQIDNIPNDGIGYGTLRYLSHEDTQTTLSQFPVPHIQLNYLGRRYTNKDTNSSPMRPARELIKQNQSTNRIDPMYIWTFGWIEDDELYVKWEYQANLYKHTTIENLVGYLLERLRVLARVGLEM